MREVLASITGLSGPQLQAHADVWLAQLAPEGKRSAASLKRCSDVLKRMGEHRYHARAYIDGGQPQTSAPAWARIRELERIITANPQSPAPRRSRQQQPAESSIRVFVSHSSADSDMASLFVQLLREALSLSRKEIRCTSTAGYKLPAGAKTDEHLRREIHETDVLLGLISPNSVKSLYVAFELGARWASEKPFFPILLPGSPSSVITGPLRNLRVLDASLRGDLYQLVEDVGAELSRETNYPITYCDFVERILSADPVDHVTLIAGESEVGAPQFNPATWRETEERFRAINGEATALWRQYQDTKVVKWSVYPNSRGGGTARTIDRFESEAYAAGAIMRGGPQVPLRFVDTPVTDTFDLWLNAVAHLVQAERSISGHGRDEGGAYESGSHRERGGCVGCGVRSLFDAASQVDTAIFAVFEEA